MTDQEQLQTARSQLVARLLELTTKPQPSYSIDGQSVSMTEYQQFLLDGIRKLDEVLAGGDPLFELTQAFT